MNRQEYLDELRERLFVYGAPEPRSAEIVAEVESHLVESGEDPVEAFGLPDRYAANVLLGGRIRPARWLPPAVAGLGGALTGLAATAPLLDRDRLVVDSNAVLVLVVLTAAMLVVFLPAVARRFPRTLTRLIMALAVIAVAGSCVSALGYFTPLGEWVLFTLEPAVGLAIGIGMLIAGALLARWLPPWRRARRNPPAP